MPTQPGATSKAGITTSSTGERHIPASTRADGSVRKEIRVRPGYRPPEDVEVYKNRTAEAFRTRGSGGVPGADALGAKPTASGAASKNAKRRENRKKAAAADTADGSSKTQSDQPSAVAEAENAIEQSAPPPNPEAETAKEARKLAKKLRQAKELKDRKDKGEGLLPEQFEKVIRINELIRQLDSLGFDANGEKKTQSTTEP